MKWSMQSLGAIDPLIAEMDLGILAASQAGAQSLVLALQDRNPSAAEPLAERWETLTAEANALAAQRNTDIELAVWEAEAARLNVEFEQLRVDAAVALEEEHKKTQFRGALMGASIVAVGAAGLFWALRKRKKR